MWVGGAERELVSRLGYACMKPGVCRLRGRWCVPTLLSAACMLALCACQRPGGLTDPARLSAHANTVESPAAATPFSPGQAESDLSAYLRRPQVPMFRLLVLHVQIPHDELDAAERIWRYVREGFLPADQQLSLRRNGLRVGIGHAQGWGPIRDAINGIDGHMVNVSQPVRIPAGFPLALELDTEPADQTLFFMGPDGVISGETWTDSRDVLRVIYQPDPAVPGAALLDIRPEVRQRRPGTQLVQTGAGLSQIPRTSARTFDVAGVTASLEDGEFLLIGPSKGDLLYGLIGEVFLSRDVDGTRYDSYVILRPGSEQDEQGG